MPNTHSTLTSLFSDIANAIRAKKGTSADIVADNFPSEIASIPSGGVTPTGSITLTEEGSFNVTDKATAIVDFSATRANLAEAVTAKGVDTLPTSSFDTIATNIGLISGGGVPLPPGITKQDSGSFTLASDTLCSDYPVNHALGVTPKGFIIWSDDISAYEPSSNYAMKYFCIIAEAYNTGASAKSFANGALVYRASTGKAAVLSNDATTAALASVWANSSTIALVRVTINYKANATYKWLAWA